MTEQPCVYLLNYVLLQPYWLLVVSKLVFSVLSFLWNGARKLIYMYCCCCCCCCEKEEEEKKEGDGEKEDSLLDKIYIKYIQIDLYFLVIQIGFQLLHFLYIVATTLNYTPTSGPPPSSWQRYQMLYASYFNSGVATVAHAVLRKTEDQIEKKKRKWALILFTPLLLSVAPFFITHSIPMILAYGWISLPLFLIGLGAALLMRKLSHKQITWYTLLILIILDTTYFATFVGLFQATVNYGVLLYERKYSYLHVVVEEYDLRSTECYFDDLVHQLQTRNILNLLSFLI